MSILYIPIGYKMNIQPIMKMPGKKTKVMIFRMSPETERILKELAKHHGTNKTAMIECLLIEKSKKLKINEKA
jgi:hypothetical protein